MSNIQQLLTAHMAIWTAADTAKRSGRGRASSNAASVYGVKKLRELILELAVRGKLVPQDANDEPASELLKRIQAEKAKLVAEGKIKKEKLLAAITEDEKPFEFPQGWVWSRLGNTGKIFNGNSINEDEKERKYTNLKEGFPFIATKDVGYGRDVIDYTNGVLIPFENESLKIAHKGSVLICSEGGSAGKKIGMSDIDICFGNKLYANETWAGIDPRFIFYVYQSPSFFQSFSERMTGIIGGISINEFLNILIPIPPRFEQVRIVQKVDELMALCDQLEAQHRNAAEAHEKLVSHLLGTLTQSQSADDFSANWQRISAHFDTLFTTESSIDALKQTLLQLAVMGKLVPQDANDEPASELLKRIQAEKAKLLAEGKIKKDKPLAPIGDDEKSFELPQGWEWVRLGATLDITGGVTLGRKIIGADLVDLPYLRVANVQRGYLILDSIKTVEIRQSELSRYQLLKDDLLVTEGGDWDKVGRTAIWNTEIKNCLHQNHIFRMRKITTELSSSWIEMYMNSIAKTYFQAASKQTTNLASINMTQLKNCLLAVPTLREQHRIIAKSDQLMALCDQLIARTIDTNQLQQKLAEVMVEHATAQ